MEKISIEDNKEVNITDPLMWGFKWDLKYQSKTRQKMEGLKKFHFKKINKAKKYHRWQCNFWNNRLNLTTSKNIVIFDCYNIDKENDMINYKRTFMHTTFKYEEIEWFVKVMMGIDYAIEEGKKEFKIPMLKDYKFVTSYSNGAWEFEKIEEDEFDEVPNEKTSVVFWYDDCGGHICLAKGWEEDFLDIDRCMQDSEKNKIYLDIARQHLDIPLSMMGEILIDMADCL